MNVFELFAKLGIDTSEYESGLSGAEERGHSFASSLSSGIGAAARIGAAAVATTTAAVVAGSAAFVNGVSNVAEYADNIDKMSQKLNLSAESYQEWDFIMQHAGTSIDSMQAGMKTLANAVENGNDAFERLGLSQEEIASMSEEELFGATITALQDVEDETERTYLAGQLLGRGATELGALLNMSAEETEEMRQSVHELGGVMSDEAVSAGAQFQDSLLNMQTALSGIKNNLLSEFLPSFSTVMDGLSAIFSGDDGGLALVRQGVEDFAEQMNETLPRALDIGGDILGILGDSIIENLPTIIDTAATVTERLGAGLITNLPALLRAAVQIVSRISSGLIENLPLILSAGLEIVAQLGQALIDNAPVMIPQIIGVITEITRTLTSPDNLGAMIRGGIELLIAVGNGLMEALPDLIALIPEIIANLIVVLAESYPDIIDSNLEFFGMIFELLGGLADNLADWLFDTFGTMVVDVAEGFSKVFNKVGEWLGKVFDKFGETWDNVISGVGTFFSDIWSDFTTGLNNIIDKITGFGDDVWDKFTGIWDDAKSIVSGAIDFIKGLFDFEWSLPQIQLPHFSITGGEAPWGFGGQGSLPRISVDWYAKAMSNPMLLTDATIFGYGSSGRALGGGEAGDEMIYGRSNLMKDIAEVVGSVIGAGQPNVIQVYIGTEKIDEFVVSSNQRSNFISGGRG